MGEEGSDLRELASRAAGHDPDAWEALYRRSYARMFAFARRRLRNDGEADDAVSETMTRALRKIDGFQWRAGGIEAWLFGILRNVVHEQHRRHHVGLVTVGSDDPPAPSPEPQDAVVTHDEEAAMRRAFALLSAFDQEILELRVVDGLSAEEVAEVVGKRAGAVRMAQSRALERLRVVWGEVAGAY